MFTNGVVFLNNANKLTSIHEIENLFLKTFTEGITGLNGDIPKTFWKLIKFIKDTKARLLIVIDDVEEVIIND